MKSVHPLQLSRGKIKTHILLTGIAALLMVTPALAQQHWTRHWMQDYAKE